MYDIFNLSSNSLPILSKIIPYNSLSVPSLSTIAIFIAFVIVNLFWFSSPNIYFIFFFIFNDFLLK